MSSRNLKEKIQVLYTLMDKTGTYSKIAGASICSLFANTRQKVTVHIFHDGSINVENKEKFYKLAQKYRQELIFYDVHRLLPELWQEAERIYAEAMQSGRYTEAALYRLVASQVLPGDINRLIYLDADTIVNMDIRELWSEPIGKSGMAAVRETTMLLHYGMAPEGDSAEPFYDCVDNITMDNCFNSGVLLMELDKIRSLGNILLSGLQILAQYPNKSCFFDQNILNYYFAQDLTPLKWQYNILTHWDKQYKESNKPYGILHYMGHNLEMSSEDARDTLFYDYFLQTPWGDGKFFCRNYEVMNAVYLQMLGPHLRTMRRLLSLMAVKSPVIMAAKECEDRVWKLFAAPDDIDMEPMAKADKTETPERRYELPKGVIFVSLGKDGNEQLQFNYDVDTHIYLIFSRHYGHLKELLKEAGLKENEHFMSGAFLLAGKSWLESIIQPNRFFEML